MRCPSHSIKSGNNSVYNKISFNYAYICNKAQRILQKEGKIMYTIQTREYKSIKE